LPIPGMMTSDVVGSQTPAQGPTLKHDVWFCFQNLQLPRNAGLLEHRLSQGANLRHSRPLYLARVVDLDGADPHPQASGSSGRKLGIRALHTTRGSQEVNFPSSVANGAHHPHHVSLTQSHSFRRARFSAMAVVSGPSVLWEVGGQGCILSIKFWPVGDGGSLKNLRLLVWFDGATDAQVSSIIILMPPKSFLFAPRARSS